MTSFANRSLTPGPSPKERGDNHGKTNYLKKSADAQAIL